MKSGDITNTTLRSLDFPANFKMELNAVFEALGGKWASGYTQGANYQSWVSGTQGAVVAMVRFTGWENVATRLPSHCFGIILRNGMTPAAFDGSVLQTEGNAGDVVIFVGRRV